MFRRLAVDDDQFLVLEDLSTTTADVVAVGEKARPKKRQIPLGYIIS